jgi:hypothetical protein
MPMDLDHRIKCENSKTTITVLCNPYQNSNAIHQRNREINPTMHMEADNARNNQSNPEQSSAKLAASQQHNTTGS